MHLVIDEAVDLVDGDTQAARLCRQAVVVEYSVDGGDRAVEAYGVVLRVVLHRPCCCILWQLIHLVSETEVI